MIGGQSAMLDAGLAGLCGVETRVLVPAVKWNLERFPQDCMFPVSKEHPEKRRIGFRREAEE